jgi:hypothetical protein
MATIDSPLTGAVPSLGTDASTSATTSATATEELVETPVEQTAEPGAESTETKPGTGAETEGELEQSPDGRVIPPKYRDLFKKDPELKSLFFSHRAYKSAFPTPSEATAARELLDRVGGEEGIASVEEQESERVRLNQQYSSPSVEHKREFVRGLLNDNPSAFKSMVPVAMDEYAKADPQGYSRTMARVMVNTLSQSFNGVGMQRALNFVRQNLKSNPEQATRDLEAIAAEFGRFEELATSRSGVDEERERFEQEKQEWDRNRQRAETESSNTEYQTNARRDGTSAIRRHLTQLLTGKPAMTPEDLKDTVENIAQRISRMSMADKDWIAKRDAILRRGDAVRAQRFVLAKLNQLLPEAAKQELRRLNAFAKPSPASPQNRQQQPANRGGAPGGGTNGTVRLAKQPAASEINWSRTSSSDVMKGNATLKDGRRVQWE